MKKILSFFALLVLIHAVSVSAETLHGHFIRTLGFYPPIQERRDVYQALYPSEHYQGSAAQNIKFLGYLQTNKPELEGVESLGSATNTPETVAFYEDSLASPITAAATSFNLVRGTDKHGNSLAPRTYGWVVGEGTSNEELILADCNGTACTSATRGVSVLTGTSTVSGAAKAHRRGESVKITDAPILLFLSNVVHGRQNIEALLNYATTTIVCSASSPNTAICGKAYIDGVAVAGASDANETTKGIVELATGPEAAASTNLGGTGARLALGANIASSSPWTPASVIVSTESNGKINAGMMGTGTFPWLFTYGSTTFIGTTTFAGATTTFSNDNGKIGLGTTSPFMTGFNNALSEYVKGGFAVGTTATTSSGNVAIGNYLQVGGTASTSALNVNANNGCLGCQKGHEIVTATNSGPTSQFSTANASVSCSAGKKLVGGGASNNAGDGKVALMESYPVSNTQWSVTYTALAAAGANTITVYAVCVTP